MTRQQRAIRRLDQLHQRAKRTQRPEDAAAYLRAKRRLDRRLGMAVVSDARE